MLDAGGILVPVAGGEPVRLPLAGRFNVANPLAAAHAAAILGVDAATVARGPVAAPGRPRSHGAGRSRSAPSPSWWTSPHTPDGL